MKTPATIYVCGDCDAQSPKWTGQCLECGAWGSLRATRQRAAAAGGVRGAGPMGSGARGSAVMADAAETTAFEDIPATAEGRAKTGIAEADRVFGGGIVDGSVTLLGGEPGIGKSTLSIMLCARLAAAGRSVLYVSGEESAAQVKLRADRLGLAQRGIRFASVTDVDALVATLEAAFGGAAGGAMDRARTDRAVTDRSPRVATPGFAVIDSVQMLRSEDIPSEAGAAGQVRGAAGRLVAWAKSSGTPLLLIGHVTKDGTVAGPKTLEHVVDAVLSFEGERTHPLRVLRALKNRFGSTDESGMFEMTDAGLTEVRNPSAFLLDGRRADAPGSAVTCSLEGTRPMLIEIQALVQRTTFGYPARKASGFDAARLDMLLAVLAKRGGIDLSGYDVYVNVAGGMKVREPAADLAVTLALASAYKDESLPPGLVAWGEVGLAGEVRGVPSGDRRLAEAAALGLTSAIVPMTRTGTSTGTRAERKAAPTGITSVGTGTVADALRAAFAGARRSEAAARQGGTVAPQKTMTAAR